MPNLTPEQMAEFRKYEQKQAGNPVDEKALRAVIDDDAQADAESYAKRLVHNRQYNHAPGTAKPRLLAEKDKE